MAGRNSPLRWRSGQSPLGWLALIVIAIVALFDAERAQVEELHREVFDLRSRDIDQDEGKYGFAHGAHGRAHFRRNEV